MKNERRVKGPVGASWSRPRPARYRSRLGIALVLSLCFHAFILSLQFGAAGFGLPGLAWPWAERRVQASNLTVRLVNVPRPPAPVPAPAPVPPAVLPRVPPATVTAELPEPVPPSRADKSFEVRPPRAARAVPPPEPLSLPRRETTEPAPTAEARAREREIRTRPQPEILAQSDPQQETFNVPPPAPAEPEQQRAPETAARKQAEEPPPAAQETEQAVRKQAEEQAARRADELELRRQEQARVQAEEAARLQAEAATRQRAEDDARQRALALQKELEAKKQEEARRLEDEKKQEEARRQALELEARRRAEEDGRRKAEGERRKEEARKQEEAKKQEEEERRRTAEVERRKEDEKKQEEARRIAPEAEVLRRAEEAARQPAPAGAPGGGTPADAPPAPGALSGRDLAAKALEQLRTPGAVRTDPPRPPSQPGSADGSRRRSILGAERDVTLRMYADSWRWKIERNATINFPSWASRKARDYPVVTVAIRKDGSLEDVIIHRSSGLRELDEAVRRIVRLYAPYSAFPPALARQYDVIEIRRVWYFEDTLRIREEL